MLSLTFLYFTKKSCHILRGHHEAMSHHVYVDTRQSSKQALPVKHFNPSP